MTNESNIISFDFARRAKHNHDRYCRRGSIGIFSCDYCKLKRYLSSLKSPVCIPMAKAKG